jgi:amino acid adenylation domain-containing protein
MSSPGPEQAGFDLSLQQERLWVAEPEGPTARSQVVIDLSGDVSPDAVRAGLAAVVARHEALRTTFARPAGMRVPLQVIQDDLAPHWSIARGTSEDAAAAGERAAVLDLARGPVLRALLLDPDGAPRLVLTAPSVVVDARGLLLVGAEVTRVLAGEALDDEPVQHADYAAWQREQWSEHSAPAQTSPGGELPFAAPLLPGTAVVRPLPDGVATSVAASARAAGVPVRDAWLGVWLLLAARLSGDADVGVACGAEGRVGDELRGAVGPYAVAVAVSALVGPDDTVLDVVRRVAAARSVAERELGAAAPGIPPLPYGFRWDEPTDARVLAAASTGSCVELAVGDAAFVVAGSAADAERVAGSLEQLATVLAADPDVGAWDVDVVAPVERKRLAAALTGPTVELPDVSGMHELVERQAARTPDAPAVHGADGTLTYRQLDERANRLAHLLRSLGVVAGTPVALCLDRSTDLVTALLAVLKAGGAYVPLHPEHPKARLAFQLADTSAAVVLAAESLLAALPETSAQVVCLNRDRARIDAELATALEPVTDADSIAYVIYTSGSTGAPKGVAVRHGGLVNYATAIVRSLELDRESLRFGLVTTVSTDLGNTSIIGALASGGCLELVPVEAAMDGAAYADYVARNPIDVLKIAPSHLAALMSGAEPARILPRQRLIVGGEALSWPLADVVRAAGRCTVTNHYGPTETTIGTLVECLGPGPDDGPRLGRTVPLGRPLANTVARVVDAAGHQVPVGVPGELHLGGAGVARGYWNDDVQTARRFHDDAAGGGRFYRTGDLVRLLPDARVEFLGRTDDQVKIRGFRVEPGEVETTLARAPGVRAAAVVATAAAADEVRLVGYVVGDVSTSADLAELRSFLSERLPAYLVPSALVPLPALPLTANGKIDRGALPAPETVPAADDQEHVAPRTEIERKIADIWAEVLRVDGISVLDDFFGLGGHSLLATQVIARIRSALGVQLPLPSLFLAPTVAGLARLVEERLTPPPVADEELARMLQELEGLSDEEAEQLLRLETDRRD